jgi:hypothetical protein
MRCVACDAAEVSERPERTAQGYRTESATLLLIMRRLMLRHGSTCTGSDGPEARDDPLPSCFPSPPRLRKLAQRARQTSHDLRHKLKSSYQFQRHFSILLAIPSQ